jgi:hypothetical protein
MFRPLLAMLQADLRERLRSPRLWWLLAGMAAMTAWALPSASADYLALTVGEHWRGRWSSAWIGMTLAVLHGALLPLAGFYVVRGTVVRDLDTRVWQLLVATPMSRAGYLLAKWASHVAVLALVLAMAVAIGLVLQQVHGEDRHVDLVGMLRPVALIALPPVLLSAALAIVFDLVPWLRRSAGNAVFFLAWLGVVGGTDATGNGTLERALAKVPGLTPDAGRVGVSLAHEALAGVAPRLFEWTQWQPAAEVVVGRVAWAVLAVALVLAMTPLLDRCAAWKAPPSAVRAGGRELRWLDRWLAPLQRWPLGVLVAAEARMVLRQRSRRWWLAMAVAAVVQAFAPDAGAAVAMLAAWLLCLDVFSRAVLRERDARTGALLFTGAGVAPRLLAVRVIVALGVAWTATGPALLRLAVARPGTAGAVALVGASIALWGLALGAACRNARPFELALLLAGYLSLQGAPVLDALAAPAVTALGHGLALPVAIALLAATWKPLIAVSR